MATLNFKDVGVKAEIAKTNVLTRNRSVQPIGIKTPLEMATEGLSTFVMHTSLQEQIKDNLRNLILTNHGERLALYEFGANLQPLVSEYSNKADFDNEAMFRINETVARWMPFVIPASFNSTPDYEDNSVLGKIRLFITYDVPSLRISQDSLEVDLYVM